MPGIPTLPTWSAMDSIQKTEFLSTANFELSIDGNPIELNRFQWYNQESDKMYVAYYAVFPPETFEVGNTYEFAGVWSIEINGFPYTYTETRTIAPY